MIDLAVLVATAFAMLILGLTVFLRNTRDTTNRLFGLLTLTSILWGVANYLSNHITGYDNQLFANKLSLSIGFLLIQSVWLLSLYFPRKISEYRLQKFISIFVTPLIIFLMLATNDMVSSIHYVAEKGITEITIGPFYYLYIYSAALFFIFIAFNFYRAYKAKDSTRLQKQQITYAAAGFLLSFLWAILTAAVIPTITNNWEISKFGTVAMIFTISLISFSIIKHKLFDIRLVVARAFAYALSLTVLGAIYTLILFVVAQKIFQNSDTVIVNQVVPLASAVVLGVSYPRIKRFFDHITNKIFFRDAYDPQAFLDELNKTIVGNIELGILLRHTTDVIQKNLKTENCFIEILENENIEERVIGVGSLQLNQSESNLIGHALRSSAKKIIVTDQLESNNEKLKQVLLNKNIGIIVSLKSNDSTKRPIANLIIGYKKSGNIFDKQDVKIIEIISDGLLIAIQNALRFEEIQQFNITLQHKVDQATLKLQKTNDKLRALDQSKDEFISMASHQLRTPLTSIKGYTSMVLDGDAGELTPSQKELLNQAYISSQRMVYLIADLLNVSRLKSGKFILDTHPTNLSDVITDEIAQVKETASAKNQTLIFKKPKHFPELMLDETKIRQVIMNFADNAIYYTQSGGKIELILKEDKNNVYFMVKDNGLGVPKAERSKLFKKFYRASNAKKARPDGTGLGLFMAKKVIDAHDGDIIFDTKDGKGSTFGFTFNKKKHKVSTVK